MRSARAAAFALVTVTVTALVGPAPTVAAPGDIDTIVGGPGRGPATLVLQEPSDVAVSATSIFVAEAGRGIVRVIDRATGYESVYAGRPDEPCSDDPAADDGGPANGVALCDPSGLALDPAGNLFVADRGHLRVRRIDATTGVIDTVAGGVGSTGGDGGPATAAGLCGPLGIALDPAGNLFIADSCDQRVRRVDAATGIISTVAGDGTPGFAGDGGPATAAKLSTPRDVSVDAAGNLYIADRFNNRVRRVDGASGIITTFAGTGSFGSTGTGGPATAARLVPLAVLVDDLHGGDVFIVEIFGHKVRRVRASDGVIVAFAGSGSPGFGGDGGPAATAPMTSPIEIAVDDDGAFIATQSRVRRVGFGSATISTVAGKIDFDDILDGVPATDTQLDLDFPGDVTFDAAGNLFFTDTYNARIRRVDAVTGIVSTVAGNGSQGYNGELVPAADVWIFFPASVAVDALGNVYYTDNNRVRVVDAVTGLVRTVAGGDSCGFSGDGLPAQLATLCVPIDLLFDAAGNLLVADTDNHRVRRIAGGTGAITTIAGNGSGGATGDGGTALGAGIGFPHGIALDLSGNLFISNGEDRVRRVAAANGTISTVAGGGAAAGDGIPATSAELAAPFGIAADGAGTLLIAELGANRVRRVDAATGIISTIAGDGEEGFTGDGGPGILAKVFQPAAVAVGPTSAVVIFDTYNQRIRRIEPPPCGNGTADAGEQCDLGLGNGSTTGCCTATCQLRASGAICRPAAGACDIADACDGASPVCPSDAAEPDSDGDAACDSVDLCTNVGGGRDLAGKPALRLARINIDPIGGNDVLTLSGEFDLPAGAAFADLDPLLLGARLVIRSVTGVKRVDVALPPGALEGPGTRGWTRRAGSWSFVDKTASPANGVIKVGLSDLARRAPGRVGLRVVGRRGGYPVAPGDEPLSITFVAGDQASSIAGLCTELAFAASECRFNVRGDRLGCRQ